MPQILQIDKEIMLQVKKHNLEKKFIKCCNLLKENLQHPGLHIEVLEPKNREIHSFRLDLKYRVIFMFRKEKTLVEILAITNHYR